MTVITYNKALVSKIASLESSIKTMRARDEKIEAAISALSTITTTETEGE